MSIKGKSPSLNEAVRRKRKGGQSAEKREENKSSVVGPKIKRKKGESLCWHSRLTKNIANTPSPWRERGGRKGAFQMSEHKGGGER